MSNHTNDGDRDEQTTNILDWVRENSEWVEANLTDRDDELGAVARTTLAHVEGSEPDLDDLDALGFSTETSGDGFGRFTLSQRRLTDEEAARMAERVRTEFESRE
jgi:hypothetical protein